MVILFLIFLIQFIIGSVCLVLSYHVQSDILYMGWKQLDNETKHQIETEYECCGFRNVSERIGEKNCINIKEPCFNVLELSMSKALRLTGAIGLVFSFSQV